MIKIGFKGFYHFGQGSQGQTTALQDLQARRAGIAASLSSTQAVLTSITAAFGTAQQNNISGLGTLAAQAALARVKAQAKARSDTILTQINSAQSTLDSAKTASKPTGTTVVGHTVIQKYVSWAGIPVTTDTTA